MTQGKLWGWFDSDRVRLGDRVRWQGREFRVITFAGPHVTLQPLPEPAALVEALYGEMAGSADFALLDEAGDVVERTRLPPLGRLLLVVGKEDRKRALMWHRHMKEVETGIRPGRRVPRAGYDPAATTMEQRLKRKAAELDELDISISWRTLDDKRRRWKQADENPLVLIIDGRKGRAPSPGGRTDPRLLEIMQEVTAILARQSGGRIGRAFDLVEERVETRYAKELEDPQEAKRLRLPRSTFYKRMHELGLSAILLGTTRQRASQASKPKKPYTPSYAVRPGQIMQIDTTPLRIKVLGDHGEVVSAEMTILIDVATRSIVALMIVPVVTGEGRPGQRVGGRATRTFDLVLLLAQAYAPMPTLPGWDPLTAASASALPFIKLREADPRFTEAAAARPVIHPRTIIVDQGSQYLSQHFEDVCNFLGITLLYARKEQPDDKPIVERVFSSFADSFSQHVAGWTGRSHAVRGRGIERQPLWTINEVQHMAHEWVALEYQQLPHEGLQHPELPGLTLSPNEMYAATVPGAGYRPRPLSPQDNRKLLLPAWVTVTDKGFDIENRTYQNEAGELRLMAGLHSGLAGPGKGGRWEARFNPYRPDVAWLYDHRGPGRWIKADFIHRRLLTDVHWTVDHWEEATAAVLADGGRKEHQAQVALAVKERRRRTRTAPPRHTRTGPWIPFQGPELDVDEPAANPYAGIGEIDLDSITPYESLPIPARPTAQPVGAVSTPSDRDGLAALFADTAPDDDLGEAPDPAFDLGLPGSTETVEGEM
ncbi:transposase [Streptomyces sp. NPDC017254]|uniref:transposase n=1 Tax=unclassified Streptomyces TaxID=2593676 RepID=UPI0037B9565C